MMMIYNKIFKNEKKKKHQKSSLVESPVELNNCSKTGVLHPKGKTPHR